MTFVHPDSMKYGALGHIISDNDTKKADSSRRWTNYAFDSYIN